MSIFLLLSFSRWDVRRVVWITPPSKFIAVLLLCVHKCGTSTVILPQWFFQVFPNIILFGSLLINNHIMLFIFFFRILVNVYNPRRNNFFLFFNFFFFLVFIILLIGVIFNDTITVATNKAPNLLNGFLNIFIMSFIFQLLNWFIILIFFFLPFLSLICSRLYLFEIIVVCTLLNDTRFHKIFGIYLNHSKGRVIRQEGKWLEFSCVVVKSFSRKDIILYIFNLCLYLRGIQSIFLAILLMKQLVAHVM